MASKALDVPCPKCGANTLVKCFANLGKPYGHMWAGRPHAARIRAAAKAEPDAKTDLWRACGCADPDNCEHVFRERPGPAAASEEVREAAGRFGARLLAEWWENDCADLDGLSVQEIAEETGLWHQVEHHAPGVECEWCGNDGPCGELTEAGLHALASRGASR